MARGQVRRGQLIATYGPGALIDLPHDAGIVAGLEGWGRLSDLEQIDEPRLSAKLSQMTGISAPRLMAPPRASDRPWEKGPGVTVWRFPEWFVVQDERQDDERVRKRRLVYVRRLDDKKRKFERKKVVPTRFVRACPRGHVDDLDWYEFVHGPDSSCRQQLWIEERGTTGDLFEMIVRCECGASVRMSDAVKHEATPLGHCSGRRPWLGPNAREDCQEPARLLIRTGSNAYFPQTVSVLSLPDRGSEIDAVVAELWGELQFVANSAELAFSKKKPQVLDRLTPFSDADVLEAIERRKHGDDDARTIKYAELDAILAAKDGYGDDVPIDPDFHARRLPESVWRRGGAFPAVESVILLHRLREVMALAGFTRLEAIAPDIDGEYDADLKPASISRDADWFPAVENRGEGIFIQIRSSAIREWLARPAVVERLHGLMGGFKAWKAKRKSKREFPGGPYLLLHTLSHLLIQSVAMRCGYPASSIRERVYSDTDGERYGVLLYTGSSDADGTLGGLVQQGRYIADHLEQAIDMGTLCSNDPVCAEHDPATTLEDRPLHGAACHGCVLVAETSCEMRNDLLDRALVVSVMGHEDVAFFCSGDKV
jgi:hypothetical protein